MPSHRDLQVPIFIVRRLYLDASWLTGIGYIMAHRDFGCLVSTRWIPSTGSHFIVRRLWLGRMPSMVLQAPIMVAASPSADFVYSP
jgi:hypothetical protein